MEIRFATPGYTEAINGSGSSVVEQVEILPEERYVGVVADSVKVVKIKKQEPNKAPRTEDTRTK